MKNLLEKYNKNKEKINFYAPIVYLIFLIILFFWIYSVLNTEEIEVKELEEKDKVERKINYKDVVITTNVFNENDELIRTFEYEIENKRNVEDVLQRLRSEMGLNFEIVEYLNRIEIVNVLDTQIPENYKWQVSFSDKDVTQNMDAFILYNYNNVRTIILKPILK